MKRATVLACSLLLSSGLALSQTIANVTATIADTNSTPYALGTYQVILVDASGNPVQSSPFVPPPVQQQGSLSGAGTLALSLYVNSTIPTPIGTQWKFNICSAAPSLKLPLTVSAQQCYTKTVTITGSGSITAALTTSIPTLYYFNPVTGVMESSNGSSGSGTVTSVTFTGDGILDSSTPSTAVTTSGTVTATPLVQSANAILAGPTTGAAANPTFRALVIADIPTGTSGATVPLLNTANTWTLGQTMTALLTANAGLAMPSGQVVAWNSDTGISRGASGTVYVGSGAAASAAGSIAATNLYVLSSGNLLSGLTTTGTGLASTLGVYWSSGASFNGTRDTSLCRNAAGILEVGSSTNCNANGTIAAAAATVGAINQSAASSTGGTCTMTTTSCTITIAHTYTTPVCIATQQSATLTGGAAGCTVSGTTVTITATVSNTETWGALVFGNPN